jgi:O-acetyl-ADP-ribose deacetylase (regulator of RNase III)
VKGGFVAAKHEYWTHQSVRALVGDSDTDPADLITQKAADVSLAAIQEGWSGPPFDPFVLANLRKIRVVPREDIGDARTVPSGTGFTIEFNPNRAKARIRYSICHELAHTLFPDCHERVQNRLTHATMKGDDWQLEMLCNLAAAEFAMPIGSLPRATEELLEIDHILELRQKYEVSAEAMLLRLVRMTDQPCSFFCASRPSGIATPRESYVIDYAKPSKAWPSGRLRPGTELPGDTVAAECTAVGYTAKGQENWAGLGKVKVECLGVSPYPSHSLPRVIGLLKPQRPASVEVPSVTYLKGDAAEPRGEDSRLLLQVVNDAALTWGGGLSLALRQKWPASQQSFRSWALEHRNLALGNIHIAAINPSLSLVSMIAQHGYGPSPKPRIRYLALQACLRKVASIAAERGATVHMPRIGCGQAGGSWDVVSELIDETLCNKEIDVFVYDLPGTKAQGHPQAAIPFPRERKA